MSTSFSFKLTSIIICLLTISNILLSQNKPNSKNYYDFYSNGDDLRGTMLETIWLDKTTISAVVKEEMEKMGFDRLTEFRVVKIDSGVYVVAICFSEKDNFGFLFEGSHDMFPNAENRELTSLNKRQNGFDYTEKIVNINGESDFVKIKNIPSNLFIIKADIYWYQKTDNSKDNKSLVTKELIIKILRKDIQAILKLRK